MTGATEPVFPGLDPDELQVTEIESLCMNCHRQGMTRLLLTRIPYFKEVILSSFDCAHCGHSSRSTDHAERIQDEGVEFELRVTRPADFNRKVARAPGAVLLLPHLDSEFPCSEASVTTLEGALADIVAKLRVAAAVTAGPAGERLEVFLDTLTAMLESESPDFVLVLRDPSGNSFLENPGAPAPDPHLRVRRFRRTPEEDAALGIEEASASNSAAAAEAAAPAVANGEARADVAEEEFDKYEVLNFQVNCPNCNGPTESRMKLVQVPYFKEVVLMATTCDACGHKDSSVKCGGGIEPLGVRLELTARDSTDLSRDVLVSDTCRIAIPDLEFETEQGSLGGKFSTVEGLLLTIRDSLAETNPCLLGDAATSPRFADFLGRLEALATAAEPRFRLVLDDPAGNSYIQNLCAPDPDPQLLVERYERSAEQSDSLGLTEMRTENYAAEEA